MRTLLLIMLLAFTQLAAQGQLRPGEIGHPKIPTKPLGGLDVDSLAKFQKATLRGKPVLNSDDTTGRWANRIYNGRRPLTAINPGFVPNTDSLKEFLDAVFYPSQAPTAGLTITYNAVTSAAQVLEKMASGADLTVTLNWSAGRQAYTDTLQTVNVNGTNVSFTPVAASGTTSGTQSAPLVRNVNTTYTNTVTTRDGKTATANATVTWRTKWYYGFVSSGITSPSDADVLVLTNAFNTTRTKSATTVANNTARRLVIAFDESLDPSNISEIWVGGLNSTGVFNRTVRSFTNASGFTTNYIIYVQNTVTSGPITFEIK